MSTDFRDALRELHTSIQLYTGQNPAAADVHPAELTRRLMDAMAASAAALAKPEQVAPTDEALYQFWESRPDLGLTCDEPVKFARAVLARYGTPANTINQENYD
jgi:hypothetical protein